MEILIMRMLTRVIIVLPLLLLANEAYGQGSFKFAKGPGELPSAYLERFRVTDVSRQLNEKERHELCRFFVQAYVVAKRQYTDEWIRPGTPIYLLFKKNFPEVEKREGESGAIIFISEIARFINSLPDYRADVEQELRRDIRRQRCTPY